MLTPAQNDRAVGAILGLAVGDALGAGYEFGPALPLSTPVEMIGGGPFNWAPGEWTDDTSMAYPLLEELAAGGDLRNEESLDRVVARWSAWEATSKDVGNQIRAVFRSAGPSPSAAALRSAAAAFTAGNPRAAGNGSLMRTAPVALGYLHNYRALGDATRAVSQLTHPDEDAVEACVIWNRLIVHAVGSKEFGLQWVLPGVHGPSHATWQSRFAEAEAKMPTDFANNGWVVHALQAAWSALIHTDNFADAVTLCIRAGGDTDTVAAIAGALAGARYGAAAIPEEWKAAIRGWPGADAQKLTAMALAAAATSVPEEEPIVPGDPEQHCPLCGKAVYYSPRYPDYVCRQCSMVVTTLDGVPVSMVNTSLSGGFSMRDAETGEELAQHSAIVLVRGERCYATEAHMGGIVIRRNPELTGD
jgi:ADP-ribosyl-[dinitrogen reductase] hydrolase